MRAEMEPVLKEALRTLALKTRDRMGLTQKKMAEVLEMNETSYSDIEGGVSMCGTLTTVLLLMNQSDPTAFLGEVSGKFDELNASKE